jgi:hypothetical protein
VKVDEKTEILGLLSTLEILSYEEFDLADTLMAAQHLQFYSLVAMGMKNDKLQLYFFICTLHKYLTIG